jgi:hypothetical protein
MSRDLPATEAWERFKDTIYKLYIVENRTLEGDDGVIMSMDSSFNFKKSRVIPC